MSTIEPVLSDPWDFGGIGLALSGASHNTNVVQPAAAPSSDTMFLSQSPSAASKPAVKKSARDFLGDNANLVNLDNLVAMPTSACAG